MIEAVLLNDTRADNHHGCDRVIAAIDALSLANGIRVIARSQAHADWRENDAIVSQMEKAALIIVNGEGSIHHDRPTGHLLLNAGRWARQHGKHSVMTNMTWQANGLKAVEKLRAFDLVSVRETASLNELERVGIAARCLPDLASYERFESGSTRKGVAVSDSVSGASSMALYRDVRRYDAQRLPIVKLPRKPLVAARWVRRHTQSKTDLLSPATLLSASQAALQDYKTQTFNRDELLRRLASFELMVTGRFHMMIFCLVTRTPFIALKSNTHKIEATVHDAGLKPWRVIDDPRKIDDQLIENASRWQPGESQSLDRYLEQGRAGIEAMFADIAGLAKV